MRKIALCFLMPALLAAGSMLVATDRAEARIRHRAHAVVVVPHAAHYVYHPRVYVSPRVEVIVPRVHVDVAPGPYIYHGYHFYDQGAVVVPGVHLQW